MAEFNGYRQGLATSLAIDYSDDSGRFDRLYQSLCASGHSTRWLHHKHTIA